MMAVGEGELQHREAAEGATTLVRNLEGKLRLQRSFRQTSW